MQAKGKPGRKFLTPLPYCGFVSCVVVLSYVHDQIVVCVLTRFAFSKHFMLTLWYESPAHLLPHTRTTNYGWYPFSWNQVGRKWRHKMPNRLFVSKDNAVDIYKTQNRAWYFFLQHKKNFFCFLHVRSWRSCFGL